jgi:hypothetical protein
LFSAGDGWGNATHSLVVELVALAQVMAQEEGVRAAQESQRQTFKAHIDELLRRVVLLPQSLALLCFILSQ